MPLVHDTRFSLAVRLGEDGVATATATGSAGFGQRRAAVHKDVDVSSDLASTLAALLEEHKDDLERDAEIAAFEHAAHGMKVDGHLDLHDEPSVEFSDEELAARRGEARATATARETAHLESRPRRIRG